MRRALFCAATRRRVGGDNGAQAFLRRWVPRCTFSTMDSGREARPDPAHSISPPFYNR
jgi:hypothetical protein